MTTILHHQTKRPARASVVPVAIEILSAFSNSVSNAWTAWRNRREIRHLLEFDDHMLADIGLSRSDVLAAMMSDPFDDPSNRLIRSRNKSRAADRSAKRLAKNSVTNGF